MRRRKTTLFPLSIAQSFSKDRLSCARRNEITGKHFAPVVRFCKSLNLLIIVVTLDENILLKSTAKCFLAFFQPQPIAPLYQKHFAVDLRRISSSRVTTITRRFRLLQNLTTGAKCLSVISLLRAQVRLSLYKNVQYSVEKGLPKDVAQKPTHLCLQATQRMVDLTRLTLRLTPHPFLLTLIKPKEKNR